MPKRDVKRVMLLEIESVYGTDPNPTGAANAIMARFPEMPDVNADYVDRQILMPWFGRSEQFPANTKVLLPFDVELAGGGAAGTAPAWGPVARMCGFAETVDVGVDVTYSPVSTGEEAATIYHNIDALRQRLNGSRGTLGFTFKAGELPYINVQAMGLYVEVDDSALPAPTFTAFQTAKIVNRVNTPTFSLHGYAAILRDLTLQMNSARIFRDWVNSKAVDLGNREPGGQVTFECPTVAQKDWFGIQAAGTLGALQLVHGTAAGNVVTIDCPKVQVKNLRPGSHEGILILTADLVIKPDAGNDDLVVTVA